MLNQMSELHNPYQASEQSFEPGIRQTEQQPMYPVRRTLTPFVGAFSGGVAGMLAGLVGGLSLMVLATILHKPDSVLFCATHFSEASSDCYTEYLVASVGGSFFGLLAGAIYGLIMGMMLAIFYHVRRIRFLSWSAILANIGGSSCGLFGVALLSDGMNLHDWVLLPAGIFAILAGGLLASLAAYAVGYMLLGVCRRE